MTQSECSDRYQLIVQSGTSEESYFADATEENNPVAKKLWERIMRGNPRAFVKSGGFKEPFSVSKMAKYMLLLLFR